MSRHNHFRFSPHLFSVFFLLVCFLVAGSLAEMVVSPPPLTSFVEFTAESWDHTQTQAEYMLVLFNNPSAAVCHECQIALFELRELAEDQKAQANLVVGQVDCSTLPHICETYEVSQKEVPQVKLLFKDVDYAFPESKIRKSSVWEFVQSNMVEKLTIIDTPEKLQSFIDANKVSVLGIFNKKTEKSIASFKRASYRLFKQVPFGLIELDASNKDQFSELFIKYDLLPENILMIKNLGGNLKNVVFKQEQISRKRISEWTSQNLPWLTKEIGIKGFSQISKGKLPIVTLYLHDLIAPNKNQLVDVLDSLIEEFKGKAVFSFKFSDEEDAEQLRIYGYDLTKDIPPVLFFDLLNSHVYTFDEQLLSVENLREWINKIFSKKINPHMIKQKAPAEDESVLIKTVVTDTYRKFTLQESDAVVFYYAPSKICKQCPAFFEEFERVANILSKEGFVFGKIDMEANPRTPGDRIAGYPLIKLFPREDKKGLIYSGKRSAEPLEQWLRENGSGVDQQKRVLLEDGRNELV